jgi:hypothetical protein
VGNQVANVLQYGSVPGKAAFSSELLRHDQERKVPSTLRRSGMTGVRGTIVGQVEVHG